jgi:hypothetical protein
VSSTSLQHRLRLVHSLRMLKLAFVKVGDAGLDVSDIRLAAHCEVSAVNKGHTSG